MVRRKTIITKDLRDVIEELVHDVTGDGSPELLTEALMNEHIRFVIAEEVERIRQVLLTRVAGHG